MLGGAAVGVFSRCLGAAAQGTPRYNDGFSNAPTGMPPQFPDLLSGYVRRPPWKVAGVDYAVGYPASTVLTDWKNIPVGGSTGVSVFGAARNIVRVDNKENKSLDGIDFSLHDGATLYIVNSPGAIVSNCKFGGSSYSKISGSIIGTDVSSPGLTVRNCIINGSGAGTGSTLIFQRGGGTIVLKYNWLRNFPQHVLEIIDGNTTVDYQFNLIEDGAKREGAHLNYLQWGGGPCAATVQFNTSKQSPQLAGGEGYQFYFNSGGNMASPACAYNTMIAYAGGAAKSMSYMIHGIPDPSHPSAAGTVSGTPALYDNYFDISGAYGALYPRSFAGWTLANNWNMRTGMAITDSP